MPLQSLQWAVGWNNAGSLQNVESTAPLFNGQPLIFESLPLDQGDVRQRADNSIALLGKQKIIWAAAAISRVQYAYIQYTFTVGGNSYSGPMTIHSLLLDYPTDAYDDFSVSLILPQEKTLERVPLGFLNFNLTFMVEAVL